MANISEKPSNSYFDPYLRITAIKITPGEYCVVADGSLIVTVVGSCVTACIRDPKLGIGGMNHFMLANLNETQPLSDPMLKLANTAMDNFVAQILRMGATRERLEAKVFGGGNVLNKLNQPNAGLRTAQFVSDYLLEHNILVVATDTLDIYPRKVYFYPNSGKVFVKKLKLLKNDTILLREKEYSVRHFGGRLP